MTQSLSQMYVHLIFSTKNRYPFINETVKSRLHKYMAGIFKNKDSPALIINSMPDHVHALFRLSKNYSLAKVVEDVKKESSRWIKALGPEYRKFSWQSGYAAFSVSSSLVKDTIEYIKNQEIHHKKISFREEIEMIVKHCDVIEYDARYFWD